MGNNGVVDSDTGEILSSSEMMKVEDADDNHYFLDIRGALYTKTGLRLPRGVRFDQYERLLETLAAIDEGIPWALGDAINYGEPEYGEKYAQAIQVTGLSYGRLSKLSYVARSFPYSDRIEGIPFSHYELLAPMMGENREIALELLASVRELDLSKRELSIEIDKARADAAQPIPGAMLDIRQIQQDKDGLPFHTVPFQPKDNLDVGAHVGWLDDLLNLVQELVLTECVEEAWDVATKAAQWARSKGLPVSHVYDVDME